jgi:hypothetical protein
MRKLKNEYKELKEGIYQLLPINNKGEYANFNTNTGLILYCKRTSNALPLPSRLTFLEFERLLAQDKKVWLGKEYTEWRNKYPEVYNRLIDKVNNRELLN